MISGELLRLLLHTDSGLRITVGGEEVVSAEAVDGELRLTTAIPDSGPGLRTALSSKGKKAPVVDDSGSDS